MRLYLILENISQHRLTYCLFCHLLEFSLDMPIERSQKEGHLRSGELVIFHFLSVYIYMSYTAFFCIGEPSTLCLLIHSIIYLSWYILTDYVFSTLCHNPKTISFGCIVHNDFLL